MLVYARGMAAGTHIVNVLAPVQEAILDRKTARRSGLRRLRTMARASQMHDALL
jgi:hypothetical protein